MRYESSAEGEDFLRERLALFGGTLFLLSTGFFLLSNLAEFLVPQHTLGRWFTLPSNQFHLAQAAVLLSLWAICRFVEVGLSALIVLDAGSLFLISTCHALIGLAWLGEDKVPTALVHAHDMSALPIVMATIIVSTTRAILVPSTERRTITAGIIAGIPTLIAAYFIHQGTANDPRWALLQTTRAGIWMLVGVAVAAIASRVVYHLHVQVRKAERLGQYTLQAKIGEGGMGLVYRASHAMLRRPTAIKLLPSERAGEHNIVRFEREVQLTSMLTHPNTIAIYDYGRTPEGTFYYAMEYLEGIDLEGLVRAEGPQPPARVAHIMAQVAGALAEAHGIGLIHRDIKPANIYLCTRGGSPDVAKVLDFGLVKQLHGPADAKLSSANVLTGTPLYLAPEAILSPHRIDARTDLYALGCVGYYLLTGHTVFAGRTLLEICGQHLHSPPVPPSERVASVISPALEALVLQCLEKDPERRPRDARELADRLAVLEDLPRWTEAEARTRWKGWPSTQHTDAEGVTAISGRVRTTEVGSLAEVSSGLAKSAGSASALRSVGLAAQSDQAVVSPRGAPLISRA